MIKADLHVHTINSHDGLLDMDYVIDSYYKKGYRVIAITDHDKLTIDKVIRYKDMTVIPGEEITSKNGVHIIGLYLKSPIESNLDECEIVNKIKLQGGIVIIPHPLRNGSGLFRVLKGETKIAEVLKKADYIESITYKEFVRGITESYFFKLFEKYKKLNTKIQFIASSDTHNIFQIGKTATYFEKNSFDTPSDILKNRILLRKCHCNYLLRFLSQLVKWAYVLLFIKLLKLNCHRRRKLKRFFIGR